MLSVIDYSLGLTTLSNSNLLKLDRVQNEALRVSLGTIKDIPIEAMSYRLDLPSMETRQGGASQSASQCDVESQEVEGCRLPEASHGWAKQNNQFSLCVASESPSK